MDRPRSLIQDAGLWVRSIQPLWCSPGCKTGRAGPPPPPLGETTQLVGAYSIVISGPTEPIRLPPAALWAAGLNYCRFIGSFKRPVVERDSGLRPLRSTSSLFSLIRRLLLTWLLPVVEAEPAIGLLQLLPLAGSNPISAAVDTRLCLTELDALRPRSGPPAQMPEWGLVEGAMRPGNIQPLKSTLRRKTH